LARRRPPLATRIGELTQLAANLSDTREARAVLRRALDPVTASPRSGSCVFILEALLIYLPPDRARALLRACAEEAAAAGYAPSRTSLCFADRLPNATGCALDEGRALLADAHFALEDATWLPKPGLARHMGVARSLLRG
jgi:hypothetical protein